MMVLSSKKRCFPTLGPYKTSVALSSDCFPWIYLLRKASDVGGGAVLSSWKDIVILGLEAVHGEIFMNTERGKHILKWSH